MNDSASQKAHIRPVHPFPARMAPSIVWDALPNKKSNPLKILDPMSGSGTTVVCARLKGHRAIGCDTDPLARLIARVWCTDFDSEKLEYRARIILERAKKIIGNLTFNESYPKNADDETCRFIDFWFDQESRCELAALSACISRVRSNKEKLLLWCAFSRIIITKTYGVSLAMDISHSRPHKVYDSAPVKPFDIFLGSVSKMIRNCPFKNNLNIAPQFDVRYGDARNLPIKSSSIDMIITSPPYLNAIDYLRGHKIFLVWMGHTISELRAIRSENIGTEISKSSRTNEEIITIMKKMGDIESLSKRNQGIILRYVCDMNKVMEECARVLKQKGRAIFVIGNSAVRKVFIKNSEALIHLAKINGLSYISRNTRTRLLESKRRYLPPPEAKTAGSNMQSRMREEVILEFRTTCN